MSFDFSLDDLLSGASPVNLGGGEIQEAGGGFDIFEPVENNLPEKLPEFDYENQVLEFNEDFEDLDEDLENIDPDKLEETEVVRSPEKQ